MDVDEAAFETQEPGLTPIPLRCATAGLARCALTTALLLARRRIRQPGDRVGRLIRFADGTTAEVYRETVIEGCTPVAPAVLVVGFRLRHVHRAWSHALFRWESELNTVLFAGFAGLVSKLWLRHDEHGLYRGIYQWDGSDLATAYVRTLWWALALVSERGSIRCAVLPGLDRDQVLADPALLVGCTAPPGDWWRPVDTEPEAPGER